jgi:hypothetical protein
MPFDELCIAWYGLIGEALKTSKDSFACWLVKLAEKSIGLT